MHMYIYIKTSAKLESDVFMLCVFLYLYRKIRRGPSTRSSGSTFLIVAPPPHPPG